MTRSVKGMTRVQPRRRARSRGQLRVPQRNQFLYSIGRSEFNESDPFFRLRFKLTSFNWILSSIHYYSTTTTTTMCPPPDAPMNGTDEMVPIDTTQPSLPPAAQTGASTVSNEAPPPANGLVSNGEHSHPPAVKSHKGVYGRASDFLSNTSNWQVRLD